MRRTSTLPRQVDGVLASFFACFETGATCGGHLRRPADFPEDSLARAVRALLGGVPGQSSTSVRYVPGSS